jgi:hemerythrin-like domain-containing protein
LGDLEEATTGMAEKGVTVTEQAPAIGRRHLLGTSIAAIGGVALSACGNSPQPKPGTPAEEPAEGEVAVTPPEDLMREHGVLKRILLIYREGIHRLQADDQAPTQALNGSAQIIRSFIEDYHGHLEEQYVFPKLEQAGKLTDITTVLRTQHQRGRTLTDRVLSATAGAAMPNLPARQALIQDMSAFIRMFEPHEAREDTVIFPALRDVVPIQEFRELAEIFEDEEHRRFGPTGFQGIVDKVADIEKSLGIYDLNQFTPAE